MNLFETYRPWLRGAMFNYKVRLVFSGEEVVSNESGIVFEGGGRLEAAFWLIVHRVIIGMEKKRNGINNVKFWRPLVSSSPVSFLQRRRTAPCPSPLASAFLRPHDMSSQAVLRPLRLPH